MKHKSSIESNSRRDFIKGTVAGVAVAVGATSGLGITAASAKSCTSGFVDDPSDVPSLKGKTIGISVVGTDHYWDLMAYQGQLHEVQRLGGKAIPLNANRKAQRQVSQLQTLIQQKPDAIIEQLGNIKTLTPWFKKIREAGIPLFTVDTATPYAINNTTSDNYSMGARLALQMIADMNAEGHILVFNGFYGVPVIKIRYDELRYVMKSFPDVEIIQPELRDVIPNTVQSAYSDVQAMLTKYPKDGDIKAIWTAWDTPQIGTTMAVQASGRKGIGTYGIDGTPQVIKMVADPKSPAAAVMAQKPYQIGRTAVRNTARYLAGQDVPPFTFVSHTLVTKENAEQTAPPLLKLAKEVKSASEK